MGEMLSLHFVTSNCPILSHILTNVSSYTWTMFLFSSTDMYFSQYCVNMMQLMFNHDLWWFINDLDWILDVLSSLINLNDVSRPYENNPYSYGTCFSVHPILISSGTNYALVWYQCSARSVPTSTTIWY